MKRVGTGLLFLSILIFILMLAETVMAAQATGSLSVSAAVSSECRITSGSGGNITFGAYDPLSDTPKYAVGNVILRCVKGTQYKVYITGDRVMSGGGNTLIFRLCNESNCQTDFPSNNSIGYSTADSFSPITKDIYGQIDAGRDVVAASYTATLMTVVEY